MWASIIAIDGLADWGRALHHVCRLAGHGRSAVGHPHLRLRGHGLRAAGHGWAGAEDVCKGRVPGARGLAVGAARILAALLVAVVRHRASSVGDCEAVWGIRRLCAAGPGFLGRRQQVGGGVGGGRRGRGHTRGRQERDWPRAGRLGVQQLACRGESRCRRAGSGDGRAGRPARGGRAEGGGSSSSSVGGPSNEGSARKRQRGGDGSRAFVVDSRRVERKVVQVFGSELGASSSRTGLADWSRCILTLCDASTTPSSAICLARDILSAAPSTRRHVVQRAHAHLCPVLRNGECRPTSMTS